MSIVSLHLLRYIYSVCKGGNSMKQIAFILLVFLKTLNLEAAGNIPLAVGNTWVYADTVLLLNSIVLKQNLITISLNNTYVAKDTTVYIFTVHDSGFVRQETTNVAYDILQTDTTLETGGNYICRPNSHNVLFFNGRDTSGQDGQVTYESINENIHDTIYKIQKWSGHQPGFVNALYESTPCFGLVLKHVFINMRVMTYDTMTVLIQFNGSPVAAPRFAVSTNSSQAQAGFSSRRARTNPTTMIAIKNSRQQANNSFIQLNGRIAAHDVHGVLLMLPRIR